MNKYRLWRIWEGKEYCAYSEILHTQKLLAPLLKTPGNPTKARWFESQMHHCTTEIAFTLVVACYVQTLTKTLMYMQLQMQYLSSCYSKTCNYQAYSLSILILSFQLSSFKLYKLSTLQLSTLLTRVLYSWAATLKGLSITLNTCAYKRSAPHKTKKCKSFASKL